MGFVRDGVKNDMLPVRHRRLYGVKRQGEIIYGGLKQGAGGRRPASPPIGAELRLGQTARRVPITL
jgi:hypothetical protein